MSNDPSSLEDLLTDFEAAGLSTPAFVYDLALIARAGERLRSLSDDTGIRFTYSIKACALPPVMLSLLPFVTGFSVSSLFEAKLVTEALGSAMGEKTLHVTAPVYSQSDVLSLSNLCGYVVFNSLPQLNSLSESARANASVGLRVNPGVSFVEDVRYDPCRPSSKLGVSLGLLAADDALNGLPIDGLHFHSNSGSSQLSQLVETARVLRGAIPEVLDRVSWINMGGGYYYDDESARLRLREATDSLSGAGSMEFFMEPGEYLVGDAGFLATRVLDIFRSGNKRIAIVDGTLNHVPECFEYQFEPDAIGHDEGAEHEYVVAGCSCLSGDLFGTYRFSRPLQVEDVVVFAGVGAYSAVKSNPFTGIPLPTVYCRDLKGEFRKWNSYGYEKYNSLWTED